MNQRNTEPIKNSGSAKELRKGKKKDASNDWNSTPQKTTHPKDKMVV